MKKIRIAAGALALLLVLIFVFPLLYPMNLYAPQLEKNLSALLGLPVKIGDISVAYAPMPQFVLEGVQLGGADGASLSRVGVRPDYLSWIGGGMRIRQLTLDEGQVSGAFLVRSPDLLRSLSRDQHYLIRQMQISRINIGMARTAIGPVSGTLLLDRKGGFQELKVNLDESASWLTVTPLDDRYLFSFESQPWPMPGFDALRFSTITVKGVGNSDGVEFNDIRGVLYGGTLQGEAKLFHDGQWRLAGKYRLNNLQAEPLALATNKATTVEGRLNAHGTFLASERFLEDLALRPQLIAHASIKDGTVNNLDLITAIRYNTSAGHGLRGGKTRFDDLTFDLLRRPQLLQFSGVNLQSGLLAASGSLMLNDKQQWGGQLSVRLKSPVNPLSAILQVSGPLESPLLRPRPILAPGSTQEEMAQPGEGNEDLSAVEN